MKVVHLLRKYNPDEWGGTETVVKQLFDALERYHIHPVAYCPRIHAVAGQDPFAESGFPVKRFKACVPVWGISAEQRAALVSIGGNLLSFSALWLLLKEKDISLIHSHTHNRLGGIALTAARMRKIPLVVTLHGGVLDLPAAAREHFLKPLQGGVEWGKIFGLPLRSRHVLAEADALVTCNKTEAALLKKEYPRQRVITQAHGVVASEYQRDCRVYAWNAFPPIIGKQLLLSVGRLDTIKNQRWLIEQLPAILTKHPGAILVLAGSCTDADYGKSIELEIRQRGLQNHVLLTGGLPHGDPRLIGLFQQAEVLLLPSLAEPFGLVILEAWAAGKPVISSRTSGALDLICDDDTGWLFSLDEPGEFHAALDAALNDQPKTRHMGATCSALVRAKYDTMILSGRIKSLYEELIEERR